MGNQDWRNKWVYDAETQELLEGRPSERLCAASAAEEGGKVLAFFTRERNTWDYIPAHLEDNMRKLLAKSDDIAIVYVDN